MSITPNNNPLMLVYLLTLSFPFFVYRLVPPLVLFMKLSVLTVYYPIPLCVFLFGFHYLSVCCLSFRPLCVYVLFISRSTSMLLREPNHKRYIYCIDITLIIIVINIIVFIHISKTGG